MHLFHRWTNWKTIQTGDLKRAGTNSTVGFVLVQERCCRICNFVQRNSVEIYL